MRLGPGVVLMHRDGGVVVIQRRKEDDSGWWLYGMGGLADSALTSGDWGFLAPSVQHLAEHRDQLALAYIRETNPGIDMEQVKRDRWAKAVEYLRPASDDGSGTPS